MCRNGGVSTRRRKWRRGGARGAAAYRGAETKRGDAFGEEKVEAELSARRIARRCSAGGGTRGGSARRRRRARGGGERLWLLLAREWREQRGGRARGGGVGERGRCGGHRARVARLDGVRTRGGRTLPRRHDAMRGRARAGEREGTTRTRAGPALAVGREVRAKPSNEISIFLFFPNIFQILHFCLKFKFEDENEVFRNLSQNKSCSKFYSLQLSYRTFFQIPNRF
jgi:hypothetical protein